MKEQMEQELNKAELKIHEAEREFLNVYYDRISEVYIGGNDAVKKNICGRLELLIKDLGEVDLNNPFNSTIAKNIREKSGMTQAELAKLLEMDQQSLSRYERVGGPLRKHKKDEKYKKYFGWLKEQGYNPYGL